MSVNNLLRVSIQSQQFPGFYLRLNGVGFTQSADNGGGVVNAQKGVGPYETLLIINHPGENTFSILSSHFPNVYLRMDGSGVASGQSYPHGAGVVNCQVGSGPREKFRFVDQGDGSKAINSVAFPNAYLRLENVNGAGGDNGVGTVNCQNGIGPYEKFIITVL